MSKKVHVYDVECRRIVYGIIRVRAHDPVEALKLAQLAHGDSVENSVISIDIEPLVANLKGQLNPLDEALANL